MPAMVHSPLRIARPAIRDGWREGRPRTGADSFREVSWDEALDTVAGELARVREKHGDKAIFGGSYGWSSAGRVHHARTLVRRFLFLGGGCADQVGNYSFGAAYFLLPRMLGSLGPVTGRVTDWPSIVKHTRLIIAFGGLALKNGQVTPGGAGLHTMETWLRAAKEAGIEFVSVSPLKSDAPGFPRRAMGADPAEYRHRDDAGDGAHALERRPPRRSIHVALLPRLRSFPPLSAGRGRRHPEERRMGRRDHRAFPPTRSAISRAARPATRSLDHLRVVAAARAPRRAALLGGDRACRDARRHRPPRRRLCLRPRFRQRHRRAAHQCSGARGTVAGQSRENARFRSRASPTCCSIPAALTSSTGGARPIRTSGWSTGRAAIRSTTIRTSTACSAPGRSPKPSSCTRAGGTPTARHADIVLPATTPLERNDIGGSSRDPVHFRHAPRHRPRARGEERLRHFPRARAPARLRGKIHRRPRRDGLVPMGLRQFAHASAAPGRRPARLPAVLGGRLCRAAAARARLRAVRGFPSRSGKASAQHAVAPHRDFLRRDRALRLRRLPGASGLGSRRPNGSEPRPPSGGRSTS